MVVWPIAWLVSSALLLLLGAQAESGLFVAACYIGLNAATVVAEWLAHRKLGDIFMTRLGWAAALQLPVMLWLVSTPRRDQRIVDVVAAEETWTRLAAQRQDDEQS